MSAPKPLPDRPSLESLRKQAKKLARDVASGDAAAIARARAQLTKVDAPLTQRNAQLVIAREYGFAGWQDLTAEVAKRLGRGLEWAAGQAHRAIHDNDVDRLKQLLTEYPALLSWQDDKDHAGLLGFATGAYGDASTPQREEWFTRPVSAELLIDAGAVVAPAICDGIVSSHAKGLLELFQRKGLWPRALKFASASGDLDAVRAALNDSNDLTAVSEAFVVACGFGREAVAALLLDRAVVLDPDLGKHIDSSLGRPAFVAYFIEWRLDLDFAKTGGLLRAMLMAQVKRWDREGYVEEFVAALQRHPFLLAEDCVWFQNDLIGAATLNGHGACLGALLERSPAILRQQPPPPSSAIEWAITYAHTDLIPLLARIWPLPDDLPHAAGTGNLARVKRWFDESGAPALGDLQQHYPCNNPHAQQYDDLHWGAPAEQHVLDAALAFAVINRHFEVADFLLAHGANINTNWNSHEPASILHHLVFLDAYESMQYLIDRGIDMTITDYRWDSTAEGWARYGKSDEKMGQWLADAEQRRQRR